VFEFHGIKWNFEFVLWHFLNIFFRHYHYRIHYRIHIVSNSICVYSENNAYLNIYQYMINSKVEYKYGRFWGSVGMGIPWGFPRDFVVGMGWVWGLKSNPHGSPAYHTIFDPAAGPTYSKIHLRSCPRQ